MLEETYIRGGGVHIVILFQKKIIFPLLRGEAVVFKYFILLLYFPIM